MSSEATERLLISRAHGVSRTNYVHLHIKKHAYLDLRSRFERLQQSYNRECSKTAQMGEQIDALVSQAV